MALFSHIGYIVPLISVLKFNNEINEKVDNAKSWEYIQLTIAINNSSI